MTVWPLPLWVRWALALIAFAGLGIVLWGAIHASSSPSAADLRGAAEASRIDRLVVQADQAPHHGALAPGLRPAQALQRAIGEDVRSRIRRHDLSGRLESVRCRPETAVGARHELRCTARVSGFGYPFVGVVDRRAQRVTWCKRDPSPTAAQNVPLSRACSA